MIRLARVGAGLLALALSLFASACGSTPPGGHRTSLVKSPAPFRAMRDVLDKLARLHASNDAAGARAMSPEVIAEGTKFVNMKPPSDLKRENVPRVLEARARYIDLLNAWDAAVAKPDNATLWSAADALESGFWAWHDAYRGKAPEGSV